MEIQPLIGRLANSEALLQQAEEALPGLPAGALANQVAGLVEEGRSLLRAAAAELSEQAVAAAEGPILKAYALGPQLASTQQLLLERLAKIAEAGPRINERLARGREEFDIVDEYAPSSWSDIRGNGSEATAAATQAHQAWESASAKVKPETADWLGALTDVELAEARLAYADQLLDAISQRLTDLRQAEQNTRSEVENARRDVNLGWGYVRSNDADVGKAPERALGQAATLLEAIDRELAGGKPDWIAQLKQAQRVSELADQALAGARSEVDGMQAKRQRVGPAEQAAKSEAAKIANFAKLHPADVKPDQRQRIAELDRLIAQADQAAAGANQAEEEARAPAYDEALRLYGQALDEAGNLYQAVYGSFQELEALRQEALTAVQVAEQSLANTNSWYGQYGGSLPPGSNGRQLLEQAQRTFRPFNPNADARELRAIADAAVQANQLAQQAAQIIQQAAQSYQQPYQSHGGYDHRRRGSGVDLGDVLTGMALGSLFNGNRGGSWGGGYGGSWGGGHHGGHDSGGGGLFGGGGGSIGDWGGGGGDSGGSIGGWGGGGGDSGGGGGEIGGW
ncbi:MAG TPA: hypothetical protein VGE07_01720 [Herpetosiphonaceae bacterium]